MGKRKHALQKAKTMTLPALAMTDKTYIQHKGLVCPFCRSLRTIECTDEGFEECLAWRNCVCTICKMEWTDVYTLIAYEPMEVPT